MSQSNYEQQLLSIMDRSLVFQRYFAHINLMKQKSLVCQQKLSTLMQRFHKAKMNKTLEKQKELIVEIIDLHKKIEAYGKEKIAVCEQFQEQLARSKHDLEAISKMQHKSVSKRRKNSNNFYYYGHSQSLQKTCQQNKMTKSKIKRLKSHKQKQTQLTTSICQSLSTTLHQGSASYEPMDIEQPIC